jgi:superfamily II DNA or RNA helicase
MGLRDLTLRTQYRTGDDDLVRDFYVPCLSNSVLYERAVGYFRSSVYLIVGPAVVEFARRGGKIRIFCSPHLAEEDANSIQAGYEWRLRQAERVLLEEVEHLIGDASTQYRTRVLATLIASGALDVRLVVRINSSGIFHEKIGKFSDENEDVVTFLGSANETWSGWSFHGNHEAIEVFCSWNESSDRERVEKHKDYLLRLWQGLVPGLAVLEFPDAVKKRLLEVKVPDLQSVDLDKIATRVKARRRPMSHQLAAIEAWKENGERGVLQHATGSGKTYLALTAMKEHLAAGRPVIVMVPSQLLLKQWEQEVREEYPDAAVLLAGGGNNRWTIRGRLESMTAPDISGYERIVIATMQTAATDRFCSSVRGGSHLMIVADEVHQIGSPFNANSMRIQSGPRLGLSATPTRYGDPDGTAKLHEYFGRVIPPPFTLFDAINAGRLVPYEYFPHIVRLTVEEADEWKLITKMVLQEVARSPKDVSGNARLTERAKMLLINRSRIAKKASNKVQLARDVVRTSFVEGQRWLVYCEDVEQMNSVVSVLTEAGIQATEYHTAMAGDPSAVLEWFRVAGGVLVSIKCLDEGVDIPAADHALILASSQNPRQFIQRRGRVLRKSEGKYLARIHDALVLPFDLQQEPEQTALLRSELARAIEFASHAQNKSAEFDLRDAAIRVGLDPDDLTESGIEED